MPDFTQYTTAITIAGTGSAPKWVLDPIEQERLVSYSFYEQVYWNVPKIFKTAARGTEDNPIYIPTAKQIVETINRFCAPNLHVVASSLYGDPVSRQTAEMWFTDLFARERFLANFASNKRFGIIRGDWLWHITADPTRPEGFRLSLTPIDPGSYFPIYNPNNVDEIIGGHIAEQVTLDNKTYIKRQTYRKTTMMGGPSPITYESAIFEVDKWGGPAMEEGKPFQVIQAPITLPSPIDAIPIYHIQNFLTPGSVYGSSELRGFERLIVAINQGISDEELALALEGLGAYVTTSGQPVDDEGNPVAWEIGPGRVISIPVDRKFERVNGVGSVTSMQDHLRYLHQQLDESNGTSAIAKGKVDVSVASSGVALALELGPILTRAAEKELVIQAVMDNMLYDICKWAAAYEGQSAFMDLRMKTRFGEKLPLDTKQEFTNIMAMLTGGVISAQFARILLAERCGYVFPDETTIQSQILQETQDKSLITADAMGARLTSELNQIQGPTSNPSPVSSSGVGANA